MSHNSYVVKFSKLKLGWAWWVKKNPFSKFCTRPPKSQNFAPSVHSRFWGMKWSLLAKQSALVYFGWISICFEKMQYELFQKRSALMAMFKQSIDTHDRFPYLSCALQKRSSAGCQCWKPFLISVCIYLYIYNICRVFSYRGDSLTWRSRFVSA